MNIPKEIEISQKRIKEIKEEIDRLDNEKEKIERELHLLALKILP